MAKIYLELCISRGHRKLQSISISIFFYDVDYFRQCSHGEYGAPSQRNQLGLLFRALKLVLIAQYFLM